MRTHALLALTATLLACSSADNTPAGPPPGPDAPPPVASVTVTPATASLGVGQTVQLVASTKDAAGNALTGRSVAFGSSDAGKANVSSSGLVSAVAAGSATITVQSEGKSTQATITVAAAGPASFSKVSGDNQSAPVGTALPDPLVVRLTDATGNGVSDVTVAWIVTAGDGSVSAGTSTTDASGEAQVALTLGPAAGLNSVAASASGYSLTFTATATSAPPADFSGNWVGTMTWEEGDGNQRPADLEVAQQGDRADGAYIVLGGWRIPWSNGRVAGRTLTFEFYVPDGMGSNNTVQLTMNGAGDRLEGQHRSTGPAGTFTWVVRMTRVGG